MKIDLKSYGVIILLSLPTVLSAADKDVTSGNWALTFDDKSKTVSVNHQDSPIINNAYMTAKALDGSVYRSDEYPEVAFTSSPVDDEFGKGESFSYTFSGKKDSPDLRQVFYIYPSLPYMLLKGSVVSEDSDLEIIELCPMVSATDTPLSLGVSENRIYDMPFDNDNWSTFNTFSWSDGQPVTSCEATAYFNVDDRKGIVIGSVDHSTWKSAVSTTPGGNNNISNLEVKAGYISGRTWDVIDDDRASVSHHGPVKGRCVDSPKFMIGVFDDWRDGLETYGEANTVLCPKYKWDKDNSIFGWQSWGAMEFGLNYNSAMSVLDFYEKELLPAGFHNDMGRCFIVLDSGWTALDDEQLLNFVNKCKELGIVPGIYTTPFSYWGSLDNARNNVDWEGGKLGEMVLKGNGEYRKITGVSLDPTHPVVKEWNRKRFQQFKDLGFEFVKIDFMNNGSQEADSFYLPEITTGMQAYNYGLDYIREFAGDMMLDFSIAPIFPAKAHVRRIGCDAWGELNQSMYTLNCINGSWWLDRIYCFNDPDNMVLSKVPFTGKGANDENEARIRYACGLLTGMTLFGNTFAYEGDTKKVNGKTVEVKGYDDERARAVKFASNDRLTKLARVGHSFRPVEGTFNNVISLWAPDDVKTDNEFILSTDDAFYYAVFNFNTDGTSLEKAIDYERLGINPTDYVKVTELYYGDETTPDKMKINVPSKDVRIYRFDKI